MLGMLVQSTKDSFAVLTVNVRPVMHHASRIIHIMGYGWVTISLHAADVRAYCLHVKRARLVVA